MKKLRDSSYGHKHLLKRHTRFSQRPFCYTRRPWVKRIILIGGRNKPKVTFLCAPNVINNGGDSVSAFSWKFKDFCGTTSNQNCQITNTFPTWIQPCYEIRHHQTRKYDQKIVRYSYAKWYIQHHTIIYLIKVFDCFLRLYNH